jgi:hypothetical protein
MRFALVAANSPVCLHPWWVDASIVRASLPSGKPKRHIRSRLQRGPRPSQATICRQPAVATLLTTACQRKLTVLSVCSQGLLALGMFASGSSRRYAISETRAPIRRRQQTVIARHSWDDHRITERQPSLSNRRHPRHAVPRDFFSPAGPARPAPRAPRPDISPEPAKHPGQVLLAVVTRQSVLAALTQSAGPDYRRRRRERR